MQNVDEKNDHDGSAKNSPREAIKESLRKEASRKPQTNIARIKTPEDTQKRSQPKKQNPKTPRDALRRKRRDKNMRNDEKGTERKSIEKEETLKRCEETKCETLPEAIAKYRGNAKNQTQRNAKTKLKTEKLKGVNFTTRDPTLH